MMGKLSGEICKESVAQESASLARNVDLEEIQKIEMVEKISFKRAGLRS